MGTTKTPEITVTAGPKVSSRASIPREALPAPGARGAVPASAAADRPDTLALDIVPFPFDKDAPLRRDQDTDRVTDLREFLAAKGLLAYH